MMSGRGWIGWGQAMVQAWQRERVLRMSAALAFFSLFSLVPLLLVGWWVAGLLFGRQAAQGQLVTAWGHILGARGADAIQRALASPALREDNWLWSLGSIAMLLFGASWMFAELKDALNQLFGVDQAEGDWRKRVWDRLAGMGAVVVAVLGFVALALFEGLAQGISQTFGSAAYKVAYNLGFFALASLAAALSYRYLPDVRLPWRAVWPGALFTGLAVVVLKLAFSVGLSFGRITSWTGAAGSLALVLVWVFLAAMALFVGAIVAKLSARGVAPVRIERRAPSHSPRR